MTNKFLLILLLTLIYSCHCKGQEIKFNPKALDLDNKATDLVMKGKLDSALLLLDKAIQADSTYYPAYGLKASIYSQKHLPDSEIVQLENELKLKPDFAEVLCSLGMCYDKKGDSLTAFKCYNKSIELFNQRILYPDKTKKTDYTRANRLNRAVTKILTGQVKQGQDELQELKKEDPDNIDSYIINSLINKSRQEVLEELMKK